MSKNKKVFKGAFFLGVGAFVSKVLGALYRVPLTNLLGGAGLGLYQLVFPVYALMLDFSGAGVPSAVSSLIARENDRESWAKRYFVSSVKLLAVLGMLGSFIMFVFAKPIATLQSNKDAYIAYLYLSPAVFAVAIISAFRGYFQGLMDMVPTAISQVVEQVIKFLFGIALVKSFLPNIPKAVAGATLAITLSEIVALIYLFIVYQKRKTRLNLADKLKSFSPLTKNIIKTTIPVTLTGTIIPFSHVLDSLIIVNLLGVYRQDATALYGILSGVCMTVINLPVSVCYGVSTVAIPSVSSAKSQAEQLSQAKNVLLITLLLSLPCMAFCFFFSPFIINLLFKGLSVAEKGVAISLLRLVSPCIVLLSMVQTSNAVLIGKSKPYKPVISLAFGVIIKIFLNILLIAMPKINIYGGGVALIACYFVTCLINLIMIFGLKVKHANTRSYRRGYAN